MSKCLLRATQCSVCGAMMLGGEYTDEGVLTPHAPLPATERVRAAHQGEWPTCQHGTAYRAGCRSQPVLPACCCAPTPLLPSAPVATPEP
ncbi:hypothetical protein [Myxococcus eversor]|uniref:hypothetical protein n=1 Tax=Myxococcus eversor TaxID=2709661 RepID=UPI0013D5ABB0|nr:hypothetical protein [Myxococcus eversor]